MKEPLKVIACATERDNGYIYTGVHHGECEFAEWDHRLSPEYYESKYDGYSRLVQISRYMISDGTLTNRYTALEIANASGQIDNIDPHSAGAFNLSIICGPTFDLLKAKGFERANNRKVAEKLKSYDRKRDKLNKINKLRKLSPISPSGKRYKMVNEDNVSL
jgi:hypothetical protein